MGHGLQSISEIILYTELYLPLEHGKHVSVSAYKPR